MEVEVAERRINGVDAAQSQVEVGRKDCSLQGDAVPDFPVVLLRQFRIRHATGAVFLPRCQLFGRHDFVGGNIEVLFGIGSELGKKVGRLVVDVLASKPGHGDDVHDSRDSADLVAIVNGQKVCERDFVAGHDAESGVGRALVNVEAAPEGQHYTEQQ